MVPESESASDEVGGGGEEWGGGSEPYDSQTWDEHFPGRD